MVSVTVLVVVVEVEVEDVVEVVVVVVVVVFSDATVACVTDCVVAETVFVDVLGFGVVFRLVL